MPFLGYFVFLFFLPWLHPTKNPSVNIALPSHVIRPLMGKTRSLERLFICYLFVCKMFVKPNRSYPKWSAEQTLTNDMLEIAWKPKMPKGIKFFKFPLGSLIIWDNFLQRSHWGALFSIWYNVWYEAAILCFLAFFFKEKIRNQRFLSLPS